MAARPDLTLETIRTKIIYYRLSDLCFDRTFRLLYLSFRICGDNSNTDMNNFGINIKANIDIDADRDESD